MSSLKTSSVKNQEVTLPTRRIDNLDERQPTSYFNAINTKKPKNYWLISINLFLLVFALVRVPFSGSFIDAFVFEYLFGYTKYLLYFWLILTCVLAYFPIKKINVLWSFKFILGLVFVIFGLSIVISGINHFINDDNIYKYIYKTGLNQFTNLMNSYHTNHFWPYALNFFNYQFQGNDHPWFVNSFISFINPQTSDPSYAFIFTGGLIGELALSLDSIIIVILGLFIFLIAFCFLLSYKTQVLSKLFHRFFALILGIGDINKNKKIKKLSTNDDVKVLKQSKVEIKNAALNTQIKTPPVSFLTDTSVDYYQQNKLRAQQVRTKISGLVEELGLHCEYVNTIIMPMFSEILYRVDNQNTIDTIIKNESQLASLTGLKQFNLSFKNHELRIEYMNDHPSKVSIKSVLSANKISVNQQSALVGYSYGNNPLLLDLNKNHSLLIVGQKGSGSSMLLSVLILTYAYLNTPTLNSFDLICYRDNTFIQTISNLKHVDQVIKAQNATNEIGLMLEQYAKLIAQRKELLDKHNLKSIKEFNKDAESLNEQPLTYKTLIFMDFNQIVNNNFYYIKMLNNIIVAGKNLGINVIIVGNEIDSMVLDPSIYQAVDSKLILKLATESESLQVFDNYRANQLYGNGDGYYLSNKENKLRFQTSYLNQNEANEIIKIINNFYKEKQELN